MCRKNNGSNLKKNFKHSLKQKLGFWPDNEPYKNLFKNHFLNKVTTVRINKKKFKFEIKH